MDNSDITKFSITYKNIINILKYNETKEYFSEMIIDEEITIKNVQQYLENIEKYPKVTLPLDIKNNLYYTSKYILYNEIKKFIDIDITKLYNNYKNKQIAKDNTYINNKLGKNNKEKIFTLFEYLINIQQLFISSFIDNKSQYTSGYESFKFDSYNELDNILTLNSTILAFENFSFKSVMDFIKKIIRIIINTIKVVCKFIKEKILAVINKFKSKNIFNNIVFTSSIIDSSEYKNAFRKITNDILEYIDNNLIYGLNTKETVAIANCTIEFKNTAIKLMNSNISDEYYSTYSLSSMLKMIINQNINLFNSIPNTTKQFIENKEVNISDLHDVYHFCSDITKSYISKVSSQKEFQNLYETFIKNINIDISFTNDKLSNFIQDLQDLTDEKFIKTKVLPFELKINNTNYLTSLKQNDIEKYNKTIMYINNIVENFIYFMKKVSAILYISNNNKFVLYNKIISLFETKYIPHINKLPEIIKINQFKQFQEKLDTIKNKGTIEYLDWYLADEVNEYINIYLYRPINELNQFINTKIPNAVTMKYEFNIKPIILVNKAFLNLNSKYRAMILYHEYGHIYNGHNTKYVLDISNGILHKRNRALDEEIEADKCVIDKYGPRNVYNLLLSLKSMIFDIKIKTELDNRIKYILKNYNIT